MTRETAMRYRRAGKKAKGQLLDELCPLTGWSRDHARRTLRLAAAGRSGAPRKARRARQPVYGEDVMAALRRIWATLGGPCGKLLAPFMAEIIEAMQRCEEITLTDHTREQLCAMSAATIDRRLAPERRRLQVKGRSGTKPGTLLRNQIPIKTFGDWDGTVPGFCQVDLVGHEGGDWMKVASANPSGTGNFLFGVSEDPTTGLSWAVGYDTNDTTQAADSLVLRWNGSNWTKVSSPKPSATYNSLNRVSLDPTTGIAWAVGTYHNGTTSAYDTLVLGWNGSSWKKF